MRVGGCVRPTLSRLPLTTTHTRSAPSPEARGPPLGGSMRPCAAACLRGHTTWLGGVAAWFDGGFPWCRAGARSHTFRVAGGRFGDPAPSTVWLRKALRLARTHCAHPLARRPRVLVARQHAVSEPTSLTCGTWTGKRLPDHTLGPPHGARALVVHARARRVGRGGGMSGRIPHGRSRAGGGLGAVLGARRGVGGDSPGAVAVSLAREDHTTTKEQSLVGFGTLGKLRESAIFFFC